MLRNSKEIPYSSKIVTIIYKINDEWSFCTDLTTKRELIKTLDTVQEIMCAWTGKWSTSIFEVDIEKFKEDLR